MARYRGPVEKLERRLGVSLALKGERRLAGKSALDKRPYAPGQHGQRRAKISEYGLQLREKQKLLEEYKESSYTSGTKYPEDYYIDVSKYENNLEDNNSKQERYYRWSINQ